MSEPAIHSGALSAEESVAAVEPVSLDDRTEPEAGPVVRAAVANEDLTRSRRATIVSPIPALMAQTMLNLAPGATLPAVAVGDLDGALPVAVDARGDDTARIADLEREALLLDADPDSEYEVEVD